jgi:hypothetical protein
LEILQATPTKFSCEASQIADLCGKATPATRNGSFGASNHRWRVLCIQPRGLLLLLLSTAMRAVLLRPVQSVLHAVWLPPATELQLSLSAANNVHGGTSLAIAGSAKRRPTSPLLNLPARLLQKAGTHSLVTKRIDVCAHFAIKRRSSFQRGDDLRVPQWLPQRANIQPAARRSTERTSAAASQRLGLTA